MAKWGNALGGWRKQRRSNKGQFGSKAGGKASPKASSKKRVSRSEKKVLKKKAIKRNTTTSRKNGTTYETKHVRGITGGYTVQVKAFKNGEYRGSVQGYHSKKKGTATVDFLYVAPKHRGTGVSKELVKRQVHHARRHGLGVVSASERSDGGQKFVERNMNNISAGVKVTIPKRASMDSSEITSLMDMVGAGEAKSHAKQYRKAQARKAKAKAPQKKSPVNAKNIALGLAAGGIAYGAYVGGRYHVESGQLKREIAREGASTSVTQNGITITTQREFVKHARISNIHHLKNAADSNSVAGIAGNAAAYALRGNKLRPGIKTTTFIHRDDDLLGRASSLTTKNRVFAQEVYLRENERRSGRAVASLSRHIKAEQTKEVGNGRRIVVSKYRSDDSERAIRNLQKRLDKNKKSFQRSKVIVEKRYKPKGDLTAQIIKNLDDGFIGHHEDFKNRVYPTMHGKKVKSSSWF